MLFNPEQFITCPEFRKTDYVHLDEFDVEAVLSWQTDIISKKDKRLITTAQGINFWVKYNTKPLHAFKRSRVCACCGLEGTKMMLDDQRNNRGFPRFNLYGERSPIGMIEKRLILMTLDHKQPKSEGGNNGIENLQTMCVTCNQLKANRNISIERLRKLITTGDIKNLLQVQANA